MRPARCNLRAAACGILCRRPQHRPQHRRQHRPQHANCSEQAPLSFVCVHAIAFMFLRTQYVSEIAGNSIALSVEIYCNNQNWFACVLDTATHTPPIVMFRTSFYCNARLLAASLLTQITFSYSQHSLTQMPYYTFNTYSTPIDAHAVLSQFTIDVHDIIIQ